MQISKLFKKNWVKWGLVPILLAGLWLLLTFFYILKYDQGFTILSYNHNASNFISKPDGRLLKGQKITGQFVAQENNLGTVAMRFKQEQRIPWQDEDILIFRIKEKGAKDWYYQNKYYSGLTFDVPFLPIGFPLISNSKGKTYYFEFQSTKGNGENGLILSDRYPVLATKYKVDKQTLIHHPKQMLNFMYVKFVNSLNTPDIMFSSFLYILPLLFYLIWQSKGGREVVKKIPQLSNFNERFDISKGVGGAVGVIFFGFLFLCILYDIVFLQVLNDMLYIVMIALWISILKILKIDNKITFFTALLFLIIAPIALQVDNKSIAESAGAWSFMFLTGGVIVSMFELRKAK